MKRYSNPWIISVLFSIIVGIINLLTSSFIARTLGPVMRGILTEAMIWPSLVLITGSLVNTQSTAYYWSKAKNGDEHNHVITAGIAWAMILSIILLPVALSVNYFTLGLANKDSFGYANLYSIIIPAILFSYVFTPIFIAEKKMLFYWGGRLSSSLLTMSGLIIIYYFDVISVFSIIITIILATLIPNLAIGLIASRKYHFQPRWNSRLFGDMAVFGLKSNLTGVPYQLNTKLDQTMMSLLLPPQILGFYAVAYTWSSSISFIGSGLSTTMLAKGVSTDLTNNDGLNTLFSNLRVIAITLIFLGASLGVVTPYVLPTLFGASFSPAILPAVILCFASSLLSFNLVLHELIRGLGFLEIGIWAETFGLVVTVFLLSLLLIPFQAIGAAFGSLFSYLFVTIVLLGLLSRKTGINFWDIILLRKKDISSIIAFVKSYANNSKPK